MTPRELYEQRCKANRDTLRLTDQPLIDAGTVIWSLSGKGIGETVRISRYGAYEPPVAQKKGPFRVKGRGSNWLDRSRVSMHSARGRR